MDVVNTIAEVRTDYSDVPLKEQKNQIPFTAETFWGNVSGTGKNADPGVIFMRRSDMQQ